MNESYRDVFSVHPNFDDSSRETSALRIRVTSYPQYDFSQEMSKLLMRSRS